jgi:hypothetical protein
MEPSGGVWCGLRKVGANCCTVAAVAAVRRLRHVLEGNQLLRQRDDVVLLLRQRATCFGNANCNANSVPLLKAELLCARRSCSASSNGNCTF